ncbi:hypothetical protein FRC01_000819 [Tulasnella sp. 417]|nr:hypothetical protein FRC01_000819 [Tulasnella sp. 417]
MAHKAVQLGQRRQPPRRQALRETDVSQQAQQIYSDTSAQLIGLFKSGVSAASLTKAKALLDKRSQQISELELYEKGQEAYLKDAPDRLKKFGETVNSLLSGGGGMDAITVVWNKVKQVEGRGGWGDESVQEVENFVHQKIEEAKKKEGPEFEADRSALQAAKGVRPPFLSLSPSHISLALFLHADRYPIHLSIVTAKSEDAKRLVERIYPEALSVLMEKNEKA